MWSRDAFTKMRTVSLFLTLPLMNLVGSNSLLQDQSGDCEVARMKCAYRQSCARSLHSYMVDCADVLAGRTTKCPWACKKALISLTSSETGYQLSTCDCGDNEFCRQSKERAEVCRPEVTRATAGGTIVPCSVAQWICGADPLCSTALDYYHRFCRSLFMGRKCTPRCNNSLAILDRQEKAGKLRNCYCDGSEDFPCLSIRKNTQKLCYGREDTIDANPTFSTSAPSEPSSGSCSLVVNQRNLLVVLALLVLSSWLNSCRIESSGLRNSSGNCQLVRRYDKFPERTCRCSERESSHLQSIWPWWWTSEVSV